jgi:xylulokinase
MPHLLACDLGTSSCKLAVVDLDAAAPDRRIRATASEGYPTRFSGEGHAEQDPDDWLAAFAGGVRKLKDSGDLADLAGLVFTGQMSAGLLIDDDGAAVAPALIWSDQRAVAEVAEAARRMPADRFYRLAGNTLSATYTGPKIAWLARHRPDASARAAAFLQPKDWLIHQLTGVAIMDRSDASCTGLLDIAAGTWSEELFAAFGVPTALAPRLVEATSVVGPLLPGVAATLGLPAGLPVVAGGGDGPTSAVGAGIARPGEAYLSFGTSAWVSFLSDTPIDDPAQQLFSFRHVVPGLFAVTGSTQNAGAALNWLLDGVLGSSDAIGDIDAALDAVPAGVGGLVALPYLQGERTPYWDSRASGAMVGLRHEHGRTHVTRAMLEAICFQVRLILETFADVGLIASDLRVIGGLSDNDRLLGLLAAASRRGYRRVSGYRHATSIGAGFVGALALGAARDPADVADWVMTEPPVEPGTATPALERNYDVFKQLYVQLKPIFQRLSDEASV